MLGNSIWAVFLQSISIPRHKHGLEREIPGKFPLRNIMLTRLWHGILHALLAGGNAAESAAMSLSDNRGGHFMHV